jgi:hypothetical protein
VRSAPRGQRSQVPPTRHAVAAGTLRATAPDQPRTGTTSGRRRRSSCPRNPGKIRQHKTNERAPAAPAAPNYSRLPIFNTQFCNDGLREGDQRNGFSHMLIEISVTLSNTCAVLRPDDRPLRKPHVLHGSRKRQRCRQRDRKTPPPYASSADDLPSSTPDVGH